MEKNYSNKLTLNRSYLIFLLLLAIVVTLISFTFRHITFAYQSDEGLYLRYSTEVAQEGLKAFRNIFRDYFSNPEHRITQNPLRVGFIILSSLWLKLFGYSMFHLAYLSLFSYCIFLFLSFYFTKKYFGHELALLFTFLLAFSPINMAMARRALVDSTSNLFVLSSVLLFFENSKKKSTFKTLLFMATYSFAILIKESTATLSLFFMFYILVKKRLFVKEIKLSDILFITVLPFTIAGIVYIFLAGGLTAFFAAARSVVSSVKVNPYAIYFCAGPWFRYLIDFIVLSPWVFILAVGFCFYYFTTNNERKEEIIYFFVFSLSLLFIHTFLIKNIRYIMIIDFPMRLFAVLMLNKLAQFVYKEKASSIHLLLVAIIAILDYRNFYHLFVKWGIYDPVSCWLLQATHIIPWR